MDETDFQAVPRWGGFFVPPVAPFHVPELYRPAGLYWYRGGINFWTVLAWLLGVAGYQAIARLLPWLGASVPAFLLSLVIYFILNTLFVKER